MISSWTKTDAMIPDQISLKSMSLALKTRMGLKWKSLPTGQKKPDFWNYRKKYDELFGLLKIGWKVIDSELKVLLHRFDCLFWFVMMALQKEQQFLVVEVFSVDFDFMLSHVLFELLHFLVLVLIMLDLSVVEKSGSFFGELCFLFLFYCQLERYLLGRICMLLNPKRGVIRLDSIT